MKNPAKSLLYAIEFRGSCGHPEIPSKSGHEVMRAATNAGMNVLLETSTPLVSKEMLEYSIVGTSGEMSSHTGRVFAEVGPGSELNFRTDKGQSVVIELEIKSISWDIDEAAAYQAAKASDSWEGMKMHMSICWNPFSPHLTACADHFIMIFRSKS